jgi:hypothetical protein
VTRQIQRFKIEFKAPTANQAELVQAWELEEFLKLAVTLMREQGMPQDTDSLFYAKLGDLKVSGL